MSDVTLHQCEQWRPIHGWPYEISNRGRIRRAEPGHVTEVGRILNPWLAEGYLRVTLHRKHPKPRQLHSPVHILVCEAFHGARPFGHVARHLDDNKINNTPLNVMWGTPKQNSLESVINGKTRTGERHPRANFSETDVAKIRKMYKELKGDRARAPRGTITQIQDMFQTNKWAIHNIVFNSRDFWKGIY